MIIAAVHESLVGTSCLAIHGRFRITSAVDPCWASARGVGVPPVGPAIHLRTSKHARPIPSDTAHRVSALEGTSAVLVAPFDDRAGWACSPPHRRLTACLHRISASTCRRERRARCLQFVVAVHHPKPIHALGLRAEKLDALPGKCRMDRRFMRGRRTARWPATRVRRCGLATPLHDPATSTQHRQNGRGRCEQSRVAVRKAHKLQAERQPAVIEHRE